MTQRGEVLSGQGIDVVFGRGEDAFHAVHDVSISISSGESVGVVGESGSGKSTLARVLAGLQSPAKGKVQLDGVEYEGRARQWGPPRSERWKVQMVFQNPYSSLNPRMTACQTVAEAFRVWHHLPRASASDSAYGLLSSVGITHDQANLRPRSLSGGQRQRVSVARALVPDPKVLIADEPTSAIDQSAQAQLLNLLRDLQAERDLALIFISHDLAVVRYMTSHVHVMKSGEVVESGLTAEIFSTPQNPYTQALLEAIPGATALGRGLDARPLGTTLAT